MELDSAGFPSIPSRMNALFRAVAKGKGEGMTASGNDVESEAARPLAFCGDGSWLELKLLPRDD